MLASEGCGFQISVPDLCRVFASIRRKSKLDAYGVSISAIELLASVKPELVANFLTTVVASTPMMSTIAVNGRVYGKESSTTAATSLRSLCQRFRKYLMFA